MRTDDLVPLLTPPSTGKGVSLRQGVIASWNQNTAENTVLVGDTLIANLPSRVLRAITAHPRTVQRALVDLPGVEGVAQLGTTLRVLVRRDLPESQLIDALRPTDATIRFEPLGANLEDVFVAATRNKVTAL